MAASASLEVLMQEAMEIQKPHITKEPRRARSNKNVIIDWIRHAESCSNLIGKSNVDTYVGTSNIGYSNIVSQPEIPHDTSFLGKLTSFVSKLPSKIAGTNIEPPLSFIGMQHAINLGNKFMTEHNHYDMYISSALTRTITTALLSLRHRPEVIIYVVPYINERHEFDIGAGISDYQNIAVKSDLLKRKIRFIKDWLEYNWIYYFDDIEIINDFNIILDDKTTPNIKDLQDRIREYFKNRIENRFANRSDIDRSEFNIIQILRLIQNYPQLQNKYRDRIQTIQESDGIKYKINPIFLRGPKVDFSIYEYFEKTYEDTQYYNLDNFYNRVLNNIKSRFELLETIRIAAYTHGNLMREILGKFETAVPENLKGHKMMNTTVIRQIEKTNRFIFDLYQPDKIRQRYDNFESLNTNVCNNESITGLSNNYLYYGLTPEADRYQEYEHYKDIDFFKYYKLQDSLISRRMRINKEPNFNNPNYNIPLEGINQIAGNTKYYDKYMKYKSKYIKLKLFMN